MSQFHCVQSNVLYLVFTTNNQKLIGQLVFVIIIAMTITTTIILIIKSIAVIIIKTIRIVIIIT